MTEWQTGSEGMLIELSYGSTVSASGPYLEVRTYLGEQLHPALADERDRLLDHAARATNPSRSTPRRPMTGSPATACRPRSRSTPKITCGLGA